MTDVITTARYLLSKTVDSLVLLCKYCGLTEYDIHKAVSDSFRRQKVSEPVAGAGTTVSPQGSAALGGDVVDLALRSGLRRRGGRAPRDST